MNTPNKQENPAKLQRSRKTALASQNCETYIKLKNGKYVRRLGEQYGEPRIYRIIRFRFNGNPRTIRNNVTLTEAQNHCEREDTSSHSVGNGAWFDGYDYMKGQKPRE